MRLETRHLRVLCAIADAGSLRKAAVRLEMTQPAITAQLQRIEAALGGPAFLRGAEGCRPTPLGQFLVARARSLLADMDSLLEAAVGLAADGERRQLRIGCTPSHVTTGWLEQLRSLAPAADVVLHVDNSARTLMGLLGQRQLDVAYLYENEGWSMPVPAGVERRTVMAREPQFVAMAAGDPLAEAENVTLADFADSAWVINSSGDDEAAHIRRVCAAAGFTPRLVNIADIPTSRALIVRGHCIAVCQPTSIPRDELAVRRMAGDPFGVCLFLAWRTESVWEPLVPAAFDLLVREYVRGAGRNQEYGSWLANHPAATAAGATQ
jgi:DNA-binding transcriptional LysR family regulator